eukprot:TRINITY_DN14288_c0_g1_i5.p1 TRINITY_DN14288_c0_g1~~TRINITY_DN14288_c0_g1_i5.p1  ORF type:complete len:318 (-),score=85.88 TRINITY_DN14288_c0_g1_i5:189-1142(-)
MNVLFPSVFIRAMVLHQHYLTSRQNKDIPSDKPDQLSPLARAFSPYALISAYLFFYAWLGVACYTCLLFGLYFDQNLGSGASGKWVASCILTFIQDWFFVSFVGTAVGAFVATAKTRHAVDNPEESEDDKRKKLEEQRKLEEEQRNLKQQRKEFEKWRKQRTMAGQQAPHVDEDIELAPLTAKRAPTQQASQALTHTDSGPANTPAHTTPQPQPTISSLPKDESDRGGPSITPTEAKEQDVKQPEATPTPSTPRDEPVQMAQVLVETHPLGSEVASPLLPTSASSAPPPEGVEEAALKKKRTTRLGAQLEKKRTLAQ